MCGWVVGRVGGSVGVNVSEYSLFAQMTTMFAITK